MKRSLTILLIATMLLSSSCQSGEVETKDEENTTAEIIETESETETEALRSSLPDLNWEGRIFTVLGMENTTHPQFTNFEIYAENQNGEVLNDAVFHRNSLIEEKYNVKIMQYLVSEPDTELTRATTAGEQSYDVSFQGIPTINKLVSGGYFLDLYSQPYLDFVQTWWDQDANDSLSIGGKLYTTTSDFNLRDKNRVYILTYNNDLAKNYQLGDAVQLVRDGKWTLDIMTQWCEAFATDLDGDGKMTLSDYYGMGMDSYNAFAAFYFAADNNIVNKDSDGKFILQMNTERTVETIDKILKLTDPQISFYCNDVMGQSDDFWYSFYHKFRDEQQLFFPTFPHMLADASAECEFIYTIIPMPKFDETQEKYLTIVDYYGGLLFGIPTIAPAPDFSAFMLEALSYASNDTTLTAYYETTCKYKYSYNEDSSEMLDLIFDGIVYDYGYFNNIGGLTSIINADIPKKKQNNFTSLYQKRELKALSALEEIEALGN